MSVQVVTSTFYPPHGEVEVAPWDIRRLMHEALVSRLKLEGSVFACLEYRSRLTPESTTFLPLLGKPGLCPQRQLPEHLESCRVPMSHSTIPVMGTDAFFTINPLATY